MSGKSMSLVATTALIITALAACGSNPTSDFTTMCRDADYLRIEDSKCGDNASSGSTLVYISTGSDYHAPPVGGRIQQDKVLSSLPINKTVQKAAIPKEGGVVKSSPGITRGGFGFKSGSSGG